MDIPTLFTPRLILRPWAIEDAETLYHILQEKDILRYFPNPTSPALDRLERYIARHQAHWQARGYGHWAVVSREDGQVLGWNGLEYLPELNDTEVAYLLSPRVWGQGLASEAARAAVHFGLETACLESIIGLVHPENTASIRVLEKCGLAFEELITLWGIELRRYRVRRGDQGLGAKDTAGAMPRSEHSSGSIRQGIKIPASIHKSPFGVNPNSPQGFHVLSRGLSHWERSGYGRAGKDKFVSLRSSKRIQPNCLIIPAYRV